MTIVVLSQISKEILTNHFPVFAKKIVVILHGIHPVLFRTPEIFKKRLSVSDRLLITTFGFLSPNKGIEYVIKALPQIIREFPNLLYLIIGETHPVVRRESGEKYRLSLVQLVKRLNLENNIKFIDRYLPLDELLNYLRATDIYISSSLNLNQVVSGTFSYALGAGRAVISTDFKQAREVLGNSGILVPIKKSSAYKKAILDLCHDPKLRAKMHLRSYNKTRSMLWANVAHDYLLLIEATAPENMGKFLIPELKIKHLRQMTDSFGLFQFAQGKQPDPCHGYTTDDNARALIFCCEYLSNHQRNPVLSRLCIQYANFLLKQQGDDGTFVNFVKGNREQMVETHEEQMGDVFGRALLAVSVLKTTNKVSRSLCHRAAAAWERALPNLDGVRHLRAHAFCLKALCKAYSKSADSETLQRIRRQADILVGSYFAHRSGAWQWFENNLSYANGVLPEALLEAYQITGERIYKKVGLSTLKFLLRKTFSGGVYMAIGQRGWLKKGGSRGLFDQQPEDPYSTLAALVRAFIVTKKGLYARLAQKSFSWFLGNNITGDTLYDYADGGVFDGITQLGVNRNKGAEALISYLLSRNLIEELTKHEINWHKKNFSSYFPATI